jgi:hypothetical protein
MDLISALKELEKTSVGTGFACSVDTALKAMNKDEQEAFQSALNNKAVASTALWDLLNSNGYKVGKETIYKHRRKGCRCFK